MILPYHRRSMLHWIIVDWSIIANRWVNSGISGYFLNMAPTIKDDELPEKRRRGDDDIAVLSSGHQEVLPPDKNAKRSPASIIVEAIRDFRIPSDLKSMYQKNDGPSKRRATSSPI
ncbi:hypothetical protein PsorP6_006989 [Peronosclerospora sorghi]|uniref:Uncharacterized protein n=1 Tax=Peronosclerospora sorghi TaxID=230839 RepID=A0ACC0WBM2_9STRA|nr:hypothetical protein PsorP6_006989 [Peronosclerospora sorghi]